MRRAQEIHRARVQREIFVREPGLSLLARADNDVERAKKPDKEERQFSLFAPRRSADGQHISQRRLTDFHGVRCTYHCLRKDG